MFLKIVIAGDIIVAPTPYATYVNIPGMIRSIQRIIDMQPSVIIPGHGTIQYDLKYALLLKEAFTGYAATAEKAVEDKIPARDAMNTIQLPGIDIKFTGNDDVKKMGLSFFFFPLPDL